MVFQEITMRGKVYGVVHVSRHSHCKWFVLEKESKARLWFPKPFGYLFTQFFPVTYDWNTSR